MRFNRYRTPILALIGIMLIGLSVNVLAGKVDVGKREYESICAVCHGLNGKGEDGPLKPVLTNPVPNLTVLARNNNGFFPFVRVLQIIDGRRLVKSHGTPDMPIWGGSFKNQASWYFEEYPMYDAESLIRRRIQALIGYLYRLQE